MQRDSVAVSGPPAEAPPITGAFAIATHRIEGGMLLALQGELDLASAPLAAEELRRAEESHSLIVLDLQELTFMDSTGLHMALTADRRARAEGRRLVLVGVQPQVRRLLELTQCDAQLTILEDPTDLRG